MSHRYTPPKLVMVLYATQQWLFFDLFGPKIMPIRYSVNFFKSLTVVWIVFLMWFFQNWTVGMWLYLFLHGSYGILWLIKDRLFPDSLTLRKASAGSHLVLMAVLLCYWMIPLPLAMSWGVSSPSPIRVASILCPYFAGLILMMGADYQKYSTLKMRKGLISSGFFRYSRNPNYLGEWLIYLSFCLCSGHVLSFFAFFLPSLPLFTLNIYLKEQISYKTKPGYDQYGRRSNIFLIKVFENRWLDNIFQSAVAILALWIYSLESPPTFWHPLDRVCAHLLQI